MLWRSQGVGQQSGDAASVELGGACAPPQAQLEGFKSRALRAEAPTQRHLYVTEWRLHTAIEGGWRPLCIRWLSRGQ